MLRTQNRGAMGSHNPEPSFMSDEQLGGQYSATSAFLRFPFGRMSSERDTPRPQDLQPDFTASYLHDLRHNRPSKPGGARPFPGGGSARPIRAESELPPRAESAMAQPYSEVKTSTESDRSASAIGHRHTQSNMPQQDNAGRSLARPPATGQPLRNFSHLTHSSNATAASNGTGQHPGVPYKYPYYERGQRWMERQEANSLTRALQDMDLEKEQRIYSAAQDEAAELVWKHQNHNVPYRNPDASYRSHLRKGSHARSQSIGPFQELYVRKGGSTEGSRSASDSSSGSGSRKVSSGSNDSYGSNSSRERGTADTIVRRGRQLSGSMRERALAGLPIAMAKVRSLSGRRAGDGSSRKTSDKSNKSLFQNSNNQIWEEPEDAFEHSTSQPDQGDMPLRDRPRNTSYGCQQIKKKHVLTKEPAGPRVSAIDTHGNSSSWSRNAKYTKNMDSQPERSAVAETPILSNGVEIRGEDIRAATSMKRKDRSPNLPTPSMVSDAPGRPIVSFNRDFKPREVDMKEERSKAPPQIITPVDQSDSQTSNNVPAVPTINIDNLPSITVDHSQDGVSPPIPTISFGESEPTRATDCARANNAPSGISSSLHQRRTVNSTSHWSPSAWPLRAQAQCAHCAFGISGKVVTAAGERFHPECFVCFECGEHLECVAFYPEPDTFRADRVARIEARINGDMIPESQAHFTEVEDGDPGLRFYCHLDFHERFSPRCRNCKTPIEGKVIMACGGEWHEGHFFCAECGDPFDQTTPFVEKDGYAWCVGCHTRRFSGKCAGCRKPIIETVVNALGREWHEDCFTCGECGGKFKDGRFFTRAEGDKPVCVKCEERRLKA